MVAVRLSDVRYIISDRVIGYVTQMLGHLICLMWDVKSRTVRNIKAIALSAF